MGRDYSAFDYDTEDLSDYWEFRYNGEGGKARITYNLEQDADYDPTWMFVLDRFCSFLGSVMGYDVKKDIVVRGMSLDRALDNALGFGKHDDEQEKE